MFVRKAFYANPYIFFMLISFVGVAAYAGEAKIEEADLIFDVPETWTDKVEKSKIPTGQLMQLWSRSPMKIQAGNARPGMIALATPVPKDTNLVLLTQARLNGEPFNTKVPDAECLKCVRYKVRQAEGTVQAISFEPPPDCQEITTGSSETLPCQYERVKEIKFPLEPSWAFRITKQMSFGPMRILLIHALVDGKLLEITFSYPAEIAQSVEDEIAPIIGSIRKP
jgi:hypothetical protein